MPPVRGVEVAVGLIRREQVQHQLQAQKRAQGLDARHGAHGRQQAAGRGATRLDGRAPERDGLEIVI